MTCIVGFTDPKNNVTWIGGDSLSSNGFLKGVQNNCKVFHNASKPSVVMGGTTSFRHLDLLEFSTDLFSEVDCLKDFEFNRKYVVTSLIPRVISLFQNNCVTNNDTDRGGNFLVGTQGKLFEVQSDYSVLEPVCGYAAVGSGSSFALGSLKTSTTIQPVAHPAEHIKLALKAAAFCNCGVQGPFYIINSENDEVIVIDG